MKLIAAVDNNWAIGNNGRLLVRIPEDQKFFKNTTMGHVVVLGRKTLEEFPKSKPLSGRTNIILSRNREYEVEGAIVVHSIDELFVELKKYNSDDIYIIGGQSIYNELLPYCHSAVITKIHETFEADAHIASLDDMDNWNVEWQDEIREHQGIKFTFTIYKNSNVVDFE
jgi:dihydrofolate reductase